MLASYSTEPLLQDAAGRVVTGAGFGSARSGERYHQSEAPTLLYPSSSSFPSATARCQVAGKALQDPALKQLALDWLGGLLGDDALRRQVRPGRPTEG